jgi:hypothetical protein
MAAAAAFQVPSTFDRRFQPPQPGAALRRIRRWRRTRRCAAGRPGPPLEAGPCAPAWELTESGAWRTPVSDAGGCASDSLRPHALATHPSESRTLKAAATACAAGNTDAQGAPGRMETPLPHALSAGVTSAQRAWIRRSRTVTPGVLPRPPWSVARA